APIVGVTTGGATGNCAFVTPGDIASSTTKGFLYQRLPTPSNISTAKTYRLTVKLKAGSTGVKGNLYIKTRGNSTASSSPFFAVRADYASDNYAWCKYINGIATSWTEYSQTFVFSNSVSGSIISTTSPSSPAVAFTAADLDDLIFGFYSTGGTVYIDDVQLVEDATITGASTASAFTTTYGTASAAQTFSVSGSKLTANLIATAPTGFEVSSGGAYGSTTSFTQTSGSASGTLSIRLAATATVAGSYNLQNIVLSSTGATSVNIVTAASGNVVSAASGSPTGDNLNNSGLSDPQLANTNLTISSGEFIINDTKTVLSLTVAPGAKLTHSSGTLTATNGITLESDATGTATLMDSYTEPTINATVKQYVTAGRNWYMSSPLNNTADYSVLNKGNSVAEYNETTGLWPEVTSGNLTRGKGYVQVASATQGTTGTVSFSGITNSGNVAVTLTNTLAGGKGFNLVGNPYPSYLSWSAVAGNSINTNATTGAKMPTGTMWYRTINYNSKNAWAATTAYTAGDVIYNGTRFYIATSTGTSGATAPTGGVGTTGISDGVVTWDYAGSIYVFATISLDGTATPSTVSNLIPPMQAFWVKSNGGTLTFTNSMRSHESVSNKLKAPKNTANEMPLVRLSVTNGASADEAVIYASTNASNTFDAYDAPKYFNLAGSNQPEIYTQAGNEKLVINAMNELSQGTEIPLGFATEKGNNFTISASELKNFGLDMKVMLKDKQQNTEFNLTNGQAYEFSSDVVNDANRFSVIFRSLGSTTGLNNTEKLNAQVFVNAANQITIIAPEKATYSIYNTVGQLIEKCIVNSKLQTVNCKLNSGVYFVELLLNGQSEIQKVIIR
ncbi:MAG: T9SS type A sorting domain-containing protein, partial [Paludibacter sp.]